MINTCLYTVLGHYVHGYGHLFVATFSHPPSLVHPASCVLCRVSHVPRLFQRGEEWSDAYVGTGCCDTVECAVTVVDVILRNLAVNILAGVMCIPYHYQATL